MTTASSMQVQTTLKKGLNLIVLRHTEVSMEEVLSGHAKAGPDPEHLLISDREVTPEMLAAINADIKELLAKTEHKFRIKIPYTFLASAGTTKQNFTVEQKTLN